MLAAVVPCCGMTIEEDRAEVERIAVSWQDVPGLEQEAMLASSAPCWITSTRPRTPRINSGGTPRS
jgi:hypothetical protein